MKKCILFLICCVFALEAEADCWQISNIDRRNFCLGISKNDSNYCWQISDNDKKNYCLALVKRDTNYCWQIGDSDSRQQCLTFVDIR